MKKFCPCTMHARTVEHVAITRGIHHYASLIVCATALIFHDQSITVAAVHDWRRDYAVHQQMDAFVHDLFREGHGEYAGGVFRQIAISFRSA